MFVTDVFQADYAEKHQPQSFSGVDAHHKNVHAEHAIHTIIDMEKTIMLHFLLYWSEYGVDELALWPLAIKYAMWLYNLVPSKIAGLTPMELLIKTCSNH